VLGGPAAKYCAIFAAKKQKQKMQKKSFAVSWIAVFMSQWSGWHFIDAK